MLTALPDFAGVRDGLETGDSIPRCILVLMCKEMWDRSVQRKAI